MFSFESERGHFLSHVVPQIIKFSKKGYYFIVTKNLNFKIPLFVENWCGIAVLEIAFIFYICFRPVCVSHMNFLKFDFLF